MMADGVVSCGALGLPLPPPPCLALHDDNDDDEALLESVPVWGVCVCTWSIKAFDKTSKGIIIELHKRLLGENPSTSCLPHPHPTLLHKPHVQAPLYPGLVLHLFPPPFSFSSSSPSCRVSGSGSAVPLSCPCPTHHYPVQYAPFPATAGTCSGPSSSACHSLFLLLHPPRRGLSSGSVIFANISGHAAPFCES